MMTTTHSRPASPSAPLVVCVRGPSRSGKSTLCRELIRLLQADGVRVAYLKRSHHALDLPGKASARVWEAAPAAMAIRARDRVQLTLPPADDAPASLLEVLPPDIDLALLETHSPEDFPTLLAAGQPETEGEALLGRWSLATVEDDAPRLASLLRKLLPLDRSLERALRRAVQLHGGHGCAGLILGTRLALEGARALDLCLPDRQKRLVVSVEIDRCAADAIQAVTGCRPGRRTLRILDYGKLAATFTDLQTDTAVRLATRGNLRERAAELARPGEDRHAAQRRVYRELGPGELFTVETVSARIDAADLPGPPRRRVCCARCAEEVSDGREIETEAGTLCRPCAIPSSATSGSVVP